MRHQTSRCKYRNTTERVDKSTPTLEELPSLTEKKKNRYTIIASEKQNFIKVLISFLNFLIYWK